MKRLFYACYLLIAQRKTIQPINRHLSTLDFFDILCFPLCQIDLQVLENHSCKIYTSKKGDIWLTTYFSKAVSSTPLSYTKKWQYRLFIL